MKSKKMIVPEARFLSTQRTIIRAHTSEHRRCDLEAVLPRQCEDVDAVLGLYDGVFPLGAEAAIAGHGRPTVGERLGARTANVNHGFNGKDVSDLDEGAAFVVAEVEHCRFFVESAADAVPAVVLDYAESVFVGDILDGAADVVPVCTLLACGTDAFFHAELGGVDQFTGYVRDLAHAEHGGRVAVVARKDGRDVDVHDVAVFEDRLCVGDAVAHDFVDADAGVARVAMVAHAGRNALVLARVVTDKFVDFERGNAWLAHFTGADECLGSEGTRIADEFDFLSGFYFNFGHN